MGFVKDGLPLYFVGTIFDRPKINNTGYARFPIMAPVLENGSHYFQIDIFSRHLCASVRGQFTSASKPRRSRLSAISVYTV